MMSFYALEHLSFNSNNDLFQPVADFILRINGEDFIRIALLLYLLNEFLHLNTITQ